MKKLLITTTLYLVLMSSVAYTGNGTHPFDIIIGVIIFLAAVTVSVIIEVVALYFIFDIFRGGDGRLLRASIVINFLSLLFSAILAIMHSSMLLSALMDAGYDNYWTTGQLIVVGFVLLSVIIELYVLKIIFKPILSGKRVLAFIFTNIVTNALVLLSILAIVLTF